MSDIHDPSLYRKVISLTIILFIPSDPAFCPVNMTKSGDAGFLAPAEASTEKLFTCVTMQGWCLRLQPALLLVLTTKLDALNASTSRLYKVNIGINYPRKLVPAGVTVARVCILVHTRHGADLLVTGRQPIKCFLLSSCARKSS